MATPIKNGVVVRVLGEHGTRRTDYYVIGKAAVFVCSKINTDDPAAPDCDVTIGNKGMLKHMSRDSGEGSLYDIIVVPEKQVNWYNKPEDGGFEW